MVLWRLKSGRQKPTEQRQQRSGRSTSAQKQLTAKFDPALVTNLSKKSGVIKAECVVKREKRTFDDVSAARRASTLPKFWASLP
jgi:hypothetical protein